MKTHPFDKVDSQMIGVKPILDRMRPALNKLTIPGAPIPKGVLLSGPPGTGKSFLNETLIKALGITQIAPSLAAGDFSQGIKGDSERMVAHLGERAAAIYWEITAVNIDEIDALVPEVGSQSGETAMSVRSSILTQFGGPKEQYSPYLMLFGATNFLEKLDKAFSRRMEIKEFVGLPSFEARTKWIESRTMLLSPPLASGYPPNEFDQFLRQVEMSFRGVNPQEHSNLFSCVSTALSTFHISLQMNCMLCFLNVDTAPKHCRKWQQNSKSASVSSPQLKRFPSPF
eukprot:TRINITY_DN11328_c0_g1_i6.p1 TRINITY_DN11328_c0_g1~~TRINITY_DN11328_c0_g1_i6.p1  ORF type:complete len:285 (-),score=55.23 TRINITY_DN11328_c0_g1_i6:70-924(-)